MFDLQVRSGLTFLDLTVRQIEYLNTKWGTDIPLVGWLLAPEWRAGRVARRPAATTLSVLGGAVLHPRRRHTGHRRRCTEVPLLRAVVQFKDPHPLVAVAPSPQVLMNSFRTHEATVKILNKYQHHNITITCFTQSCFPRIDRDHYAPLPTGEGNSTCQPPVEVCNHLASTSATYWKRPARTHHYLPLLNVPLDVLPAGPFTAADEQRWYPPGHGDVYRALDKSGVLDALLSQVNE